MIIWGYDLFKAQNFCFIVSICCLKLVFKLSELTSLRYHSFISR